MKPIKNSKSHLYLYGMFKREVQNGNIISIQQIRPIIKWYIRLPSKYQFQIVNEMIEAGLLKRLGRNAYEIITCSIKNVPCDSLGEPLWN